ncbi:outer membrane protein assembly factor BamD [Pantoea sp. Aalb]|uniref:outer membrane protein assembly factor BamD n=1 Tax=Pantoea sp. Aalb TaxID=2576762 RepID=UPI00132A00C5|nr:outer membrane protein assembly factor BamD [Pantoea sp. Aalb]MXP67780.1 outer membrane protein assembly factor BamD [Pantoea sp. Aalb]
MIHIKQFITTNIIILLLTGCSGLSKTVENNFQDKIYAIAKKKLQNNNFAGAIKELKKLENDYSFKSYSEKVKLDLVYAYYKNANLPLAQETIASLINLNPTHPNMDYIIYMKGLIDMAMDYSGVQGTFLLNSEQRDPTYAYIAFHDFLQLLQEYPNSLYAADAQKRMLSIKERLAKYELAIVKFYTKRGAYIAVIKRVEEMLKNFSDSYYIYEALLLMENAYRELHIPEEADKIVQIILLNDFLKFKTLKK